MEEKLPARCDLHWVLLPPGTDTKNPSTEVSLESSLDNLHSVSGTSVVPDLCAVFLGMRDMHTLSLPKPCYHLEPWTWMFSLQKCSFKFIQALGLNWNFKTFSKSLTPQYLFHAVWLSILLIFCLNLVCPYGNDAKIKLLPGTFNTHINFLFK